MGTCSGSEFDDIIDGYFPLEVSIADLMRRRGIARAQLTLTQVPIMDIPGLAVHAPVPLRLSSGRVGIIQRMELCVELEGAVCLLGGMAEWLWLDGTDPGDTFDPQTRLAEPAYLQGQASNDAKDRPKVPTQISWNSFRQKP